ncbi:hypothetical protein A2V49_04770 [candidate division WWE3 bacterium RBG_19FT_COMBO_34_6]|uniref:ASCH domain-containing protein n=1 Tax=candidate division WWE3 bacterium RBG_19FT_COMBO_34_6 TaxID=1802612 RepID=A0A1F4UKM2_UNCKA|nr:MAG: hypothetical protein A2V49_04770 [candidate division WWE3 bacterium RBG_19FT_COMBO_34_6]
MDHVAIMKKQWNLSPKILEGAKTVESRWYKHKIAPWNKIKIGDAIYFKDSGNPITIRAVVSKVIQFEIENNQQAFNIMNKYSMDDLGTKTLSKDINNYISDKNYAIFIHFSKVKKVKPFEIDKKGFGMQCSWLTVESIDKIKKA